VEKEKAAEATKTIDAEWKELQMLVSALKVTSLFVSNYSDSFGYKFGSIYFVVYLNLFLYFFWH